MAGKPKTRKMFRDIEERGGEDWIFGHVESGGYYNEIAKELGVSMNLLREWRDAEPGRRERWDAAMTDRADFHLKRSLEVLDECKGYTTPEVSLAKAKADGHKFAATFLKPPEMKVSVGAGEGWKEVAEHINRNLSRLLSPTEEQVEDADYEIVEDDGDDDPLRLEGADGASE